jgi:spermidine/putrescine transport system substrate-binding protein
MKRPNPRLNRRTLMKSAGAVGLSFSLPKSVLAQSGTVNFYNWDTYIGETTLDDFTAATGIGVQYDLFADNDELFAKFRNGNPGYDLIVPTNDFVERFILPMIQAGGSRSPTCGARSVSVIAHRR